MAEKKKEVKQKPIGKMSLEELKKERNEELNKIRGSKERLVILNGLINKKTIFKGGEK